MARTRFRLRDRYKASHGNGKKARQADPEDQRSVAVTVAWMMVTLSTGAAICLSGLAYLGNRLLWGEGAAPNPLNSLPGLLQFIALITGLVSLGMIPVVYRVRMIPPPRAVTLGSIVIAISPWAIILVRYLL